MRDVDVWEVQINNDLSLQVVGMQYSFFDFDSGYVWLHEVKNRELKGWLLFGVRCFG